MQRQKKKPIIRLTLETEDKSLECQVDEFLLTKIRALCAQVRDKMNSHGGTASVALHQWHCISENQN